MYVAVYCKPPIAIVTIRCPRYEIKGQKTTDRDKETDNRKKHTAQDTFVKRMQEGAFTRGRYHAEHPDVRALNEEFREAVASLNKERQVSLFIMAHAMGETAVTAFAGMLSAAFTVNARAKMPMSEKEEQRFVTDIVEKLVASLPDSALQYSPSRIPCWATKTPITGPRAWRVLLKNWTLVRHIGSQVTNLQNPSLNRVSRVLASLPGCHSEGYWRGHAARGLMCWLGIRLDYDRDWDTLVQLLPGTSKGAQELETVRASDATRFAQRVTEECGVPMGPEDLSATLCGWTRLQ